MALLALACNSAICENWPLTCPAPAQSAVLKPRRAISSGRSSRRTWCRANTASAIVTRFPPEPNGRLHIGHAKAICIDFGIAQEFGGRCNLRFDDTNPVKESQEYVDEIERDIRWLGFDWGEHLYHASDYFEQLYQWAEQLIREGKAYVDSLTADQMREYRGTLTEPGRDSPYRNRSVEENLDLFRRMRAGEFEDGAHVLRAKIDMASGNINMRDPVMYRIRKTPHQRTGDAWVIYPMYDWAHGQSDYIEGVTYSLCSLEYEDHRPLYDWYLEALGLRPPRPRQIEFARLNLNYTVMSKRMLLELVEGGHVAGWDDPRMPTISGLRRRGYTPESIRNFCERIGVAKRNNVVDIANLEHAIREDLNLRAPRVMAVLNPLKVVIENYPEGQTEEVDVINNPEDSSAGTRKVPFGRELYIERDDFMENPPKKFFRLVARQRSAAAMRVLHQVHGRRQGSGHRRDYRAARDLRSGDTRRRFARRPQGEGDAALGVGGATRSTPKCGSTIGCSRTKTRQATDNFLDHLNPNSLEVQRRAKVEPSLANAPAGSRYQFERLGLLLRRSRFDAQARLVFNRTVSLRDTWAKIARRTGNCSR